MDEAFGFALIIAFSVMQNNEKRCKLFGYSMKKVSVKSVVIKWITAGGISLTAAAVLIAARCSQAFADWFCFNVYPFFSGIGSRVCGILPFSVGEFFVALFILGVLTGLVFLVIYVKRHKGQRVLALLGGASWGGIAAAVLFFAVTFNCLVGYSRTPFSQYSGLTIREHSAEELRGLAEHLIEEANKCAEEVELDDSGRPIKPDNFNELAVRAMSSLADSYPVLDTYYPQPKAVLASPVMSNFNLAGMYFPVTVEANYNQAMPVSSQGFTACHELSHLSGFIREDEANFIAFVACRESGDPYFRYSGYLGALTYTMNAYYSVAEREEYGELYSSICETIRAEYSYRSSYWAQYEKKVTFQAATAVNDAYLKANNQTDGTRSYGRVVDLLLAEFYK